MKLKPETIEKVYFSMRDVSQKCNVSPQTIRDWTKAASPQIGKVKRDGANNRLYTAGQAHIIYMIVGLYENKTLHLEGCNIYDIEQARANKMKTFLKNQHQKCIDILELIEYAERRNDQRRENNKLFTRIFYSLSEREADIKTTEAAIRRLNSRYTREVNKLKI